MELLWCDVLIRCCEGSPLIPGFSVIFLNRTYSGEYDNLLYFFVFQYYLIQEKRSKR